MIVLIFLNVLLLSIGDCEEPPTVILNNKSVVQGVTLTSYDGRTFNAFWSIPYGKAPSGALRFKPPQAREPWDGVLNATASGYDCPQYDVMRGITGNEDCLRLNIYSPKVPNKDKTLLPVIAFIHGGGFTTGSGSYDLYGPEKWMDYDVVLVTINYRLGLLGFLNTLDENMSGNVGLLDQILALRWIQDNIKGFGGDPNKVTIMGHSAGSASIIYHLLSPLATGLFHRAIAQSATPFASKSTYQKFPLNWAKKMAKQLECPHEDKEKMMDCFRQKSVKEILEGSQKIMAATYLPNYCAPSKEISETGIITDDPKVLIREGKFVNKVPTIIGTTEREFYIFYKETTKVCQFSNDKRILEESLPKCLHYFLEGVNSKMSDVFAAIRKEYYQDLNLDDPEIVEAVIIEFMNDLALAAGISKTADYLSSSGIPTYAYKLTHHGQYTLATLMGGKSDKYSTHADELFLQFNFLFSKHGKLYKNDRYVSQLMNSLWVAFASEKDLEVQELENGNRFNWEEYDVNQPKYLEINVKPAIREGKLCPKADFWAETIPNLISGYKSKDEL